MMDLEENMLEEYARLNQLVKVEKSCPHEDQTRRESIRKLLTNIEDLHPQGPFNIFKSVNKIFEEYLPRKD
jgi:tRNA(Ile)-lysidine synthase TilS/MesJ